MYIYNNKKNRCCLCYALLSSQISSTNSTIGYSSRANGGRYANRCCSISSFERLISSSIKFERLWRQNENDYFNSRSICFRCSNTIQQIEQIQTNMDQLNHEKQILMNKIEHHLSKRALILQGQRRQTNHCFINHQVANFLVFSFLFCYFSFQSVPMFEDDDTEEGEEKPRTVFKTNGNGHGLPLIMPTIPTNTNLVGAKRRKCNLAQKINHENKVKIAHRFY